MCKYHEVAKVVEPKIAALRAAEVELKVRQPGCMSATIVITEHVAWFSESEMRAYSVKIMMSNEERRHTGSHGSSRWQ
jgi:hypothetical protein